MIHTRLCYQQETNAPIILPDCWKERYITSKWEL